MNKSSVLLPKSHSFQGSYSKIFLFFSDSYNKVPYRKLKKDEYGLYVLELDPITKGWGFNTVVLEYLRGSLSLEKDMVDFEGFC